MAHGFAARDEEAQWADWTPTFSNLTVGNGTVIARFIQIGKLVVARFQLTLGTTSSIGSFPKVSLPVTADTSFAIFTERLGLAFFNDAGTISFVGTVIRSTADDVSFFVADTSSTYATDAGVTATVPFTWTNFDDISFVATYEAA